MASKFPQPIPGLLQNILDKLPVKEREALYKLIVEKDQQGYFLFSAEYAAMALTSEGYKMSSSAIRTYRRTSVNNPFNKENKA